jgi:hypothetical protein
MPGFLNRLWAMVDSGKVKKSKRMTKGNAKSKVDTKKTKKAMQTKKTKKCMRGGMIRDGVRPSTWPMRS